MHAINGARRLRARLGRVEGTWGKLAVTGMSWRGARGGAGCTPADGAQQGVWRRQRAAV